MSMKRANKDSAIDAVYTVKNIPETKEEREARKQFADELFSLSFFDKNMSDEEFNALLADITSRKPKHMR
jgi:hypothetical protein